MDVSSPLTGVRQTLDREGVHACLRLLNSRTPHRFTGIYRYDGDMLRNVALYDRFDPVATRGDDVAMTDAYCAIVGATQCPLEFVDARTDGRFAHKSGSSVVSYCGALIRDEAGRPFGTLCHYDVRACQASGTELALLEAVAPFVMARLRAEASGA